MIKHRIKKNLGVLSGICLILFAVVSCTKDYFLEETTFRLHVPQLEEGATDRLSNLYVFFHNDKENHVITRKVDSNTLRDEMLKQGIMRFKIPAGHDYTMTCIANTQNYLVDGSKTLQSAFISAEPWGNSRATGTAYKTLTGSGIRILSHKPITVFPINHPDGLTPHEADMDANSTTYSSQVTVKFVDLPSKVKRVEVEYYGLATHYSLYTGKFTRMETTDYYLSKTLLEDMAVDGNIKSVARTVFPSDGASVNTPGGEQPINLIVRFYDEEDNVVMVHSLDLHGYPESTINGSTYPKWDQSMGDDLKPVIKIKNKDHLIMTFKGWVVVGMELAGWGEIEDGDITPM